MSVDAATVLFEMAAAFLAAIHLTLLFRSGSASSESRSRA
jgi:hypothetical protein